MKDKLNTMKWIARNLDSLSFVGQEGACPGAYSSAAMGVESEGEVARSQPEQTWLPRSMK